MNSIDFIGEEQIEILRAKLTGMYEVFVLLSDVDKWKKLSATAETTQDYRVIYDAMKTANQAVLNMRPLVDIIERLCARFGGHDEVLAEMKAMMEDIKKMEGQVAR